MKLNNIYKYIKIIRVYNPPQAKFMVENLQFADIKEIPITVIGGLILIAIILLALGSVLLGGEEKDHNKDFIEKLKEKEKKLKEKEEHLREIEKQLRGG